jgi:hypothetical protein
MESVGGITREQTNLNPGSVLAEVSPPRCGECGANIEVRGRITHYCPNGKCPATAKSPYGDLRCCRPNCGSSDLRFESDTAMSCNKCHRSVPVDPPEIGIG